MNETYQAWAVKSFRVDHEKSLNSVVRTYRNLQEEIDPLKKMAQFNKFFSMYKAFQRARERNEAHAGAQMLTLKQEKVIAFKKNWIKLNQI